MSHVVLLGDSIFDNGSYIPPGSPDVLEQVRAKLPDGWKATMLALDGAVTTSVNSQLAKVPPDATHLVLSIGGNDALGASGILQEKANSVAEVMTRIADVRAAFGRSYGKMMDDVAKLRLPTALCTIYDARFPDPEEQRRVVAALCVFNDIITRQAFSRGCSLIDLRLICNEHDDYANPIEPSKKGGDKIASVIAKYLTATMTASRSQVFGA
jgi:hypothetical protein